MNEIEDIKAALDSRNKAALKRLTEKERRVCEIVCIALEDGWQYGIQVDRPKIESEVNKLLALDFFGTEFYDVRKEAIIEELSSYEWRKPV